MHDEWGITDGYFDVDGTWHVTLDSTRTRIREAMGVPQPGPNLWFLRNNESHPLWNPCRIVCEDGTDLGVVHELPAALPIGYHDLIPADGAAPTRLIVHPGTCPEIPRAWGVAAQVYALWSERSWGIGDLGDLRRLSAALVAAGADVVLTSPLHQPAPAFPQENSPYYPSSRRAWNPLLIDIGEPPPPALHCRPDVLIDRGGVWASKRAALEERFDAEITPGEEPAADSVAVWNALCDEFGAEWTSWPEPFRHPDSPMVIGRLADPGFARRAGFHQWCQGIVGHQLAAVQATGVELIGDLAIGFSPGGADAWAFQDLLALDVRVGAPPDPFNEAGQDWGIPPFIPWRLRNAGYEPFITTIRAALRGTNGLRLDHVMGLFRQFWIPTGSAPEAGAYITFPSDELLAILCLEATRAGAFVVGEDLGTVADGVREDLAERRIACTKVLWFEPEPPARWPERALATITTHDLPTIAGVFNGIAGEPEQRLMLARITNSSDAAGAVADAHRALLDSPAWLRLVSTDDLAGATAAPNQPGTINPTNWCRLLPVPVDEFALPHHP